MTPWWRMTLSPPLRRLTVFHFLIQCRGETGENKFLKKWFIKVAPSVKCIQLSQYFVIGIIRSARLANLIENNNLNLSFLDNFVWDEICFEVPRLDRSDLWPQCFIIPIWSSFGWVGAISDKPSSDTGKWFINAWHIKRGTPSSFLGIHLLMINAVPISIWMLMFSRISLRSLSGTAWPAVYLQWVPVSRETLSGPDYSWSLSR